VKHRITVKIIELLFVSYYYPKPNRRKCH